MEGPFRRRSCKLKGTITPGKLADIVMLDRDIHSGDPAEIDKARVVLTILDGRVVFDAN
jgi:predicted amidohydrolase YtcJ